MRFWREPRWRQLLAAWLVFVVTAGCYMVPPTLLGGSCEPSAERPPCSVPDEFPDLGPALLGWLPSLFLLTKGVFAMPAGALLHRLGPRRCIVAGNLLLTLFGSLYPAVGAWWALLLLHAGFGISYCLAGLVPLIVHANGWFGAAEKASAIGLLLTGFAAAGILWPPLTAALAVRHGWRAAAAALPAASGCIALPIALLVLRDGPGGRSPEEPGVELARHGSSSSAAASSAPAGSGGKRAAPRGGRPLCCAARGSASDSMWWAREPAMWTLFGVCFCLLCVSAVHTDSFDKVD